MKGDWQLTGSEVARTGGLGAVWTKLASKVNVTTETKASKCMYLAPVPPCDRSMLYAVSFVPYLNKCQCQFCRLCKSSQFSGAVFRTVQRSAE